MLNPTLAFLLSLFLTLLVLGLVFALLFWIIGLIVSVLPQPFKQFALVLGYVILGLMAIGFLFDLIGSFGGRHLFIQIH